MELHEGTGKGEWQRRQAGGVEVWVTGGREAVLQLQHRDDFWDLVGGEESGPDANGPSGVAGAGMEGNAKGGGGGKTGVGFAYEVPGGQGGGGPGQEGVGRGAARRRTGCEWGVNTIH